MLFFSNLGHRMLDDEYVQLGTRKCVAFVRVEPLMDRALLAASLRAMLRERDTRPRWDARYGAQYPSHVTCPPSDRPIPGH